MLLVLSRCFLKVLVHFKGSWAHRNFCCTRRRSLAICTYFGNFDSHVIFFFFLNVFSVICLSYQMQFETTFQIIFSLQIKFIQLRVHNLLKKFTKSGMKREKRYIVFDFVCWFKSFTVHSILVPFKLYQ